MSAVFVVNIKDMQVNTILGVYDWEKKAKRPVVLNIAIEMQATKAGESDDMQDTLDYAAVEQQVVARLENSAYQLIEKLVTDVGKLILAMDNRIVSVTVEADKPGALQHAKSVSVRARFAGK